MEATFGPIQMVMVEILGVIQKIMMAVFWKAKHKSLINKLIKLIQK
jgi:hypothetical protein